MHCISRTLLEALKMHYGFNVTSGLHDGTITGSPSPPGGMVAVAFAGPNGATGKFSGNDFLLSAFFGVEFVPVVQWYALHQPVLDDECLKDALRTLASVDYSHENPLHVAALYVGTALRRCYDD